MSTFDVAATMDAIAAKLIAAAVVSNAYPYPAETISPPCAVVGLPEINFDETMGRGADEATLSVYLVTGRVVEKAARDTISALIVAAKAAIETIGPNYRVTTCRIEPLNVAGVDFLSATLSVEVV